MSSHALIVKENTMNTKANTEALETFKHEVKQELSEIRRNQKDSLEKIENKKRESHQKIWEHNQKQDDLIQNHEVRIKTIEKEVGISE